MGDIRVKSDTKVKGLTQSISKELRKGKAFYVSAIGPLAVHNLVLSICYVNALYDGEFISSPSVEKTPSLHDDKETAVVKYRIEPKKGE